MSEAEEMNQTPGPEALLVERMCDAHSAAEKAGKPPYGSMWDAYQIAKAHLVSLPPPPEDSSK